MPGALKSTGYHALVLGAGTGSLGRQNLRVRGHKFTHKLDIFIIHVGNVLAAKSAGFLFDSVIHRSINFNSQTSTLKNPQTSIVNSGIGVWGLRLGISLRQKGISSFLMSASASIVGISSVAAGAGSPPSDPRRLSSIIMLSAIISVRYFLVPSGPSQERV